MSRPGRAFTRKPAPTKAALRVDAQMVVTHRVSAGIETPAHMIASIARTHSMSVGEVEALFAAERDRRAGDVA